MSAKLVVTKDVEKREVTLERILDGPADLVWRCLLTPEYLDAWWGPEGWTTETKALDARVGGSWHFRMYEGNIEVWGLATYEELRAPEYMVYSETASNAAAEKVENKQRQVTIRLTELDGEQTKITISTRFESAADLEMLVRMGMARGYDGALDKLQVLLASPLSQS